jgi:hypothetical protein
VKEVGQGKVSDLDTTMAVLCGWDLDEKFDKKNVAIFIQQYPAAALAVYRTYLKELSPARQGN